MSVPWVPLVSVVCDDGRNDSVAKYFVVKPIRKVGFLEILLYFGSGDGLRLVFSDNVLVKSGNKFNIRNTSKTY